MTPLTDEELDDIERLAGLLKSDGVWSMDISTGDALRLIAEVRQARAEIERLKKGNELLLAVIAKNPDMRHGEVV